MYRTLRLGLIAALLTAPAIAGAQNTTTHFNVAGGVSFPISDFGDRNQAGYNLIAGIGFSQRTSSLGFRVDGIYDEFSYKCNDTLLSCNGKAHAGGIAGNVVYDLLRPNSAQPNTLYLIGGIGYYSTAESFQANSLTNVGYNFGAGFKFPLSGFSPYVEARFHTIPNASVKFIPISFGLMF